MRIDRKKKRKKEEQIRNIKVGIYQGGVLHKFVYTVLVQLLVQTPGTTPGTTPDTKR